MTSCCQIKACVFLNGDTIRRAQQLCFQPNSAKQERLASTYCELYAGCKVCYVQLPCCQIAVSQLPSDLVSVFRLKNRNNDDDNCVITNYYQHGPCNVDQYVMMELLMVTAVHSVYDMISFVFKQCCGPSVRLSVPSPLLSTRPPLWASVQFYLPSTYG